MAGINNNDKTALLYAKEKTILIHEKKEENRGESKKKPFLKRGEKKGEPTKSHRVNDGNRQRTPKTVFFEVIEKQKS